MLTAMRRQSVSYEKGRGVDADDGVLEAAFEGNHGWFWRNRGESDVTVTLRTDGDYIELKRLICAGADTRPAALAGGTTMPGIMQTLVDLQKWIYGSLTEYLDAFSATGDWISLATVLPLGIVFGAIHALTPGHGKMVLASYLVGSRLAVVRSLGVAATLSMPDERCGSRSSADQGFEQSGS